MRRFPILVLTPLHFVLGGTAVFLATVSHATAEPLHARIEHVERLPSVSPNLRAGSHFDLNAEETSNNKWIKIPSWLAGGWTVNKETSVFHEDFRTGQVSTNRNEFTARSRFSYGHQRDREGGIWHYLGTPYTSKTDLSGYIEYHQVSAKDFSEIGASEVIFKTRFTVIRVNPMTMRVTKSTQQESITRYVKLSSDALKLAASTKVFDASGDPTDEQHNEAMVHRAGPFAVVEEKDGKNLHELFREFLLAHGFGNLIPD